MYIRLNFKKGNDMTTSIHSVAIADFCEDDTTVEVVTSNDKDEEETFYIQTTCNEYRSD
jgi:hypothetical protein